jgi:hypothetical protein
LETNKQNPEPVPAREKAPPTQIRFSDGEGKVLSWSSSYKRVRTDLKVRSGFWGRADRSAGQPNGPPSAVASLREVVHVPAERRRRASVARTAKNSFVDLTVVAMDQPFFILVALFVIAIVVAAIVFATRFLA